MSGATYMTKDAILAIDLGGTKVLCGVIGADGTVLGRAKQSTRSHPDASVLLEQIAACARQAVSAANIDYSRIRGVGVGVPGPVNTETGIVKVAPNLGWHDVPAKMILEKLLEVPVSIDNDVRVAMIAEHARGVARGAERAVGIFIGTGVGGGVIIDGRIYRGRDMQAGEVGHMIVKAGGPEGNCGHHGCLEAMASRTAITRDLREALGRGKKSLLTKLAGDDLSKLGSGELARAIAQDDKLAKKIVGKSAKYAGYGISCVVNLLNPDIVVLGGGVVEAVGAWYVKRATESARQNVISEDVRDVPIVQSSLGDDAGILGAAQLVLLAEQAPGTPANE